MKTVRDNFFLGLLFLVCAGTANAQWQATFGPTGLSFIRVQCFAKQGTNLFAGPCTPAYFSHGGVFLSTNNGTNWTQVNTDLTDTSMISLVTSGTNLFAASQETSTLPFSSRVFVSTNNGTNWGLATTGF